MEWFRQMQSRGQMHVRRLDHAVHNLREYALKRHYADLQSSAYKTIPQRRLRTPSQFNSAISPSIMLDAVFTLRTSVKIGKFRRHCCL